MLRESEFWKNGKVRILLCLEVILLLIGVAGLFGKTGIVVGREDTAKLIDEGVSLPAGVYTLKLYYEAEGSDLGYFGVAVEEPMYKTLLSNDVPLYGGIGVRECEFYLRERTDNLKAVLNVPENVAVQGLELISTNKGSRIFLFWVILCSLLLDGFLVLFLYHRKHPIPADRQLVIFGIPILTLAASIPAMVDYHMIGADLVFHMERIEALSQSICRGELSTRIESMWMAGHGYANSIFYGDTWLSVPALLRVLGFSMDSAYRIFLVSVNLATALVAYVSFSKCFRSRIVGMFGCALYTFAPYRIYNIYNRAAVGEFTAMIFLPLLAWGFYRIYTEDPEKKGYLRNWVIPVIGFSGIIQSHALTCEMAGGFVALLCLVLWKKTFRKRTFLVLCAVVGMTVVINAWYLVPFLDLMQADRYYLGNQANVLIQSRGILPAQIFYTLQAGGSSSRFVENGMVGTEPIGLGAALLLCLLLWLWLRAKGRGTQGLEEVRKEKAAGDAACGLLFLGLFMSTCYFPWDFLSSLNRVFATLIGSLQFPTRITAIVTVLGVFLGCAAGVWILREEKRAGGSIPGGGILSGRMILAGIVAVAMVFGSYQVNDILLTRDQFLRLYTAQNVGTTAVLGAEYLPLGVDINHMTYHDPVLSEGIVMENYEKDGLKAEAYVEAEQDGYIEFPLLYYKGYHATAEELGGEMPVVKGDNGDVRIEFPAGFHGNIRVWYGGMWYWRVAEAVSVLAGVGLLVYYIGGRRKGFLSGQKTPAKKI